MADTLEGEILSSPEIPLAKNNPFATFITQIDAISIDDVVGEARLGQGLSFHEARSPLQSIKNFVEELRFLDATGMPSQLLGKSITAFQNVLNSIQQIKTFNIQNYSGNPGVRSSLVQELSRAYENLVESAVPILLYGALRSSGIKTAQAQTHAVLAEVERNRKQLDSVVNEAKELLAGQKKLSAEIAIAGYGTLFAKEAKEHDAAANRWLIITGVLAGLTILAAVANYLASVKLLNEFSKMSNSQVQNFPTSLTVQFTIAKVILFTIGLSAAYWSARVYRSHRHNSIVNKHRANALTSFQEFVRTATDPEIKNAVLLQTTSCIYAPQTTGFSSGNDTDGDSPLKILEIVRNFQK
jgi:hypothetical protein